MKKTAQKHEKGAPLPVLPPLVRWGAGFRGHGLDFFRFFKSQDQIFDSEFWKIWKRMMESHGFDVVGTPKIPVRAKKL